MNSTLDQLIQNAAPGSTISIEGMSLDFVLAVLARQNRKIPKLAFSVQREAIASTPSNLKWTHLTVKQTAPLLIASLEDAFKGTLESLSPSEREENTRILLRASELGQAYRFDQETTLAGLIIFRDFEFENASCTLVSWVWSNRQANLERGQFRAAVSCLLKKNAKSKILSAIHIENRASLNFFAKLGFMPLCLSIPEP